MRGNIFLDERRQDFIDRYLADVHQRVGTRDPLHRLHLIPLRLRDSPVQRISVVVLLQNLPVRHGCHPLVIRFEPPGMWTWLDESEVSPIVEVARMCEHSMKLVLPGSGPVSCVVEKFVKVDVEREFEAIIKLRVRVRIPPVTL